MTEASRQAGDSCGDEGLSGCRGQGQLLQPPSSDTHSPSRGPAAASAASGTGGGGADPGAWGLLWAEPGPVGRGGRVKWAWAQGTCGCHSHDPAAQDPRTHTGLQLGLDVAQRVKGLVQDVPQGRVGHGPQDPQRQGQLCLQGHRALPHLRGTETVRGLPERELGGDREGGQGEEGEGQGEGTAGQAGRTGEGQWAGRERDR